VKDVIVRPSGQFDAAWMRCFLELRLVPGLERMDRAVYERAVWVGDEPMVLNVRFVDLKPRPSEIHVRSTPSRPEPSLEPLVVTLFDLDADLAAFRRQVRSDSRLNDLVRRRPGVRLARYIDPFEGLARAILGQQVSLGAARTVIARLVERFGTRLKGSALTAFPTPSRVRDAGPARLQSIGLTRARARTLFSAAEASLDGRLEWHRLRAASADEAQAALVALPGIGPWTAAYVRMRVLGDRDAFPESDLGVLKAVSRLIGRRRRLAPREVQERAERWRPWRAYATLHLWSSLADGAGARRQPVREGEAGR
jgi:3-methyladenine DNA glycosylase/8-oxoguanine DNA glycosylase